MSEELIDEVEALNSIYPGCMEKKSNLIYDLTVPDLDAKIQVSFSSTYPEERPHLLSVRTRSQDEAQTLQLLDDILTNVFVSGQVCVFDFLESSREVLESIEAEILEPPSSMDNEKAEATEEDIFAGWIESDPIVDRKSVFIARAAQVSSADEAADKVNKLKLDRKIAKATHNMTAWRIKQENGISFQDCDDDGETAAGGRLLHLLQLTDCWNVAVCVSRWYGGIHLGPDRFKHINSSARDALVKGGFIDTPKDKNGGKKSKK
ncbi:hypothetical protein TRICI_004874 [Trichomonascus ciferrii]|uniref:RWD domain-containing protein n=1 Tax=Trichomonascus ciferrii TaxID=44093 RepID=A0A642UYG9_9ASCO|nr:hypothetical protein TRICI_004874 [Trichomonascus ciferrii]